MKKIIGIGMPIILLLVGVVSYYIYNQIGSSNVIEQENIEQDNFLKGKQAVVYLSTTAEQDMDNNGISYAVFINDEGVASGYKMKGLELGSIAKSNDGVFLVDKNKLRLIDKTYQEFNMEKDQYTGERTGYIEEQDLYFSIFNTGFNASGNYDSNVLFGNSADGFKDGNIPYYILASGVDKDEVIILTNDVEKNKYHLRKVMLTKDELQVNDIIQLENDGDLEYANLSPIVSDEQFYYFVLNEYVNETNANTVLFRINKNTYEQEKIIVTQHANVEQTSASVPYNVKNSAYLHNGEFYYMNGLGEVFVLDTKTNEMNRRFSIENATLDGVRHNEQLFFQDENLYVVRYDEKRKNKYFIEVYSLKSGEKVKEIEIKGLKEIISSVKGKSVYAYDFKMLK